MEDKELLSLSLFFFLSLLQRLRTKPDVPPVVRLRPLIWATLARLPVNQPSLTFRPAFDTFGGRTAVDFLPSNTLTVVPPRLISLGAFSTLSRNRNLFGFFCSGTASSGGGVGGRTSGAALRISSGRSAGRAGRRLSWMTDPWRVAVLSETSS